MIDETAFIAIRIALFQYFRASSKVTRSFSSSASVSITACNETHRSILLHYVEETASNV
jgi:hypothetical protein